MSERFLIVGLGNPGAQYENTRHNVGFMCADELVRAHGFSFDPKKKSKARIADGVIRQQRVLVAKPQTFMNLSGSAVQGLVMFYKIPPENILVIFDDLDLPLGMLRIRPKGGNGGHNGMRDIIQKIGTQDFPRIRFGIGRPPGQMDPAAYVLRPFDSDEKRLVNLGIDRVRQAIETWLTDSIDIAMNRYNGPVEPPAPPAESSADSSDDSAAASPESRPESQQE